MQHTVDAPVCRKTVRINGLVLAFVHRVHCRCCYW